MRRAGLVESVRGPQGGHLLARPPEQISLLDVPTVLEGPLLPDEPAREGLSPTVPEDLALADELWGELRGKIASVLATVTLDDLCQRKRQGVEQSMCYI